MISSENNIFYNYFFFESITYREGLSLLGSPIFDQGFKNNVEKTIITVENVLNKVELFNRHVAYTLIKNCLFIPTFNFLLRTTPFWKFPNYVNSIDSSLKSCLERILNLRLTDIQWRQSTLPIRFGGLGIRRISDICLPAFLSSINGVKKLVSLLLNSKDNELIIHHYDEALAKVEEIGTHGLSCFKSSGRFSRHTEINSIINRSLISIHVNSTLEPNGLSRNDGKRPDGMTLVPWIKGQPLVWDVTVDTLADSHVLKSSEISGFAAEMACKHKHSKYSSIISSNYVFKGLAFETLGLGAKKPSISLRNSFSRV
jgi:hypothetical protein